MLVCLHAVRALRVSFFVPAPPRMSMEEEKDGQMLEHLSDVSLWVSAVSFVLRV